MRRYIDNRTTVIDNNIYYAINRTAAGIWVTAVCTRVRPKISLMGKLNNTVR